MNVQQSKGEVLQSDDNGEKVALVKACAAKGAV